MTTIVFSFSLVILGGLAYIALKTGVAYGSKLPVDKAKNPQFFWLLTICYIAGAAISAIKVVIDLFHEILK
jgi:hypothetical protein